MKVPLFPFPVPGGCGVDDDETLIKMRSLSNKTLVQLNVSVISPLFCKLEPDYKNLLLMICAFIIGGSHPTPWMHTPHQINRKKNNDN